MGQHKLIVMRHAKSDWAAGDGSDFERPLNRRGRNDAFRMGRWLRGLNLAPTCIKSSPARRTVQTAEIAARALNGLPIIYESTLYLADFKELTEITARPPSDCWILLGHNPGLEMLVSFLDPKLDSQPKFSKLMPTASIYVFEVNTDEWGLAQGCGTLLVHPRPTQLG